MRMGSIWGSAQTQKNTMSFEIKELLDQQNILHDLHVLLYHADW